MKIVSHKIVKYHYLELEVNDPTKTYNGEIFLYRRAFGGNPTWELHDGVDWDELDDEWPDDLISPTELEQLFVEYQKANMHISCVNLA